MSRPFTRPTLAQARINAMKYCAYQERCHSEVQNKLYEMGLRSDEADVVLVFLIQNNFLNEERFARAFVGGKFRVKQWGRRKIIYELKGKGINNKLISESLNEIGDEDYLKTLRELIQKKDKQISERNMHIRIGKIRNYLVQKGYEFELIREEIQSYINEK